MDNQDAYVKAAEIADRLLARGYPVLHFGACEGMIVIRFHGPRAQDIHAEAEDADFEGFSRAFEQAPAS